MELPGFGVFVGSGEVPGGGVADGGDQRDDEHLEFHDGFGSDAACDGDGERYGGEREQGVDVRGQRRFEPAGDEL